MAVSVDGRAIFDGMVPIPCYGPVGGSFLGADTMNEPFDQAKLDQDRTAFLNHVPLMLWGLFNGFQEEGFGEAQAFELTKEYLRTAFQPTPNWEP